MEEFKAIYDEKEDWLYLTKTNGSVHVEDTEIGKGIYPKECTYPISTITWNKIDASKDRSRVFETFSYFLGKFNFKHLE